jgi:hypothetical protein
MKKPLNQHEITFQDPESVSIHDKNDIHNGYTENGKTLIEAKTNLINWFIRRVLSDSYEINYYNWASSTGVKYTTRCLVPNPPVGFDLFYIVFNFDPSKNIKDYAKLSGHRFVIVPQGKKIKCQGTRKNFSFYGNYIIFQQNDNPRDGFILPQGSYELRYNEFVKKWIGLPKFWKPKNLL